MAAQIRSSIPAKPTVDNASRDDLAVGDVVTLVAVPPAPGTTWAWTLAFVPEGSTAVLTPPANATTAGPLTFTADLVGPYLVRLVVDAGLPTESTQYVRLRAPTASLGLLLVAAGERRDSTGTVPVDVDIEGWANEQNFNLQAVESAVTPGPWISLNGSEVANWTNAANTGAYRVVGDMVEMRGFVLATAGLINLAAGAIYSSWPPVALQPAQQPSVFPMVFSNDTGATFFPGVLSVTANVQPGATGATGVPATGDFISLEGIRWSVTP